MAFDPTGAVLDEVEEKPKFNPHGAVLDGPVSGFNPQGAIPEEDFIAQKKDDESFDPASYAVQNPHDFDLAYSVDKARSNRTAGEWTKQAVSTLVNPATYLNAGKGVINFLGGLVATTGNLTDQTASGLTGQIARVAGNDNLADSADQRALTAKAQSILAAQGIEGNLENAARIIGKYGKNILNVALPLGMGQAVNASIGEQTPEQKEESSRTDFQKRVDLARNQAQLAQNKPLDTGFSAGLVRATQGVNPSEIANPEVLEEVGANPVNPYMVGMMTAAADPINLALPLAAKFPGVRTISGGIVEGSGRALQWPGKIASAIPGKIGKMATGVVGIESVLHPVLTAKIGATVAGAKGLQWFGRGLQEQGAALRKGAPSALDAESSIARITGGSAKSANTQRFIGDTANAGASTAIGMAPLNAVLSEGDPHKFVDSTVGAGVFGAAFGAFSSARPALVEAARPFLRSKGLESMNVNDAVGRKSAEFLNTLPEAQRNSALELMGVFQGMPTINAQGQQVPARMLIHSAEGYQKALSEVTNAPAMGGGRGFFWDATGTAHINGESSSFSNPKQAAHTMGHEFGGHAAINILEAATSKGGPIYESLFNTVREGLTTKDGKPTVQFRKFIEGYNRDFGSERLKANDPEAMHEFIAETAGQIIAGKGAAEIALPKNLLDRAQDKAGRFMASLIGIDTRKIGGPTHFDREEIGNITKAVSDTLSQLAGLKLREGKALDVPAQTSRERIIELNEILATPRPPLDAPAESVAQWAKNQREAMAELKIQQDEGKTPFPANGPAPSPPNVSVPSPVSATPPPLPTGATPPPLPVQVPVPPIVAPVNAPVSVGSDGKPIPNPIPAPQPKTTVETGSNTPKAPEGTPPIVPPKPPNPLGGDGWKTPQEPGLSSRQQRTFNKSNTTVGSRELGGVSGTRINRNNESDMAHLDRALENVPDEVLGGRVVTKAEEAIKDGKTIDISYQSAELSNDGIKRKSWSREGATPTNQDRIKDQKLSDIGLSERKTVQKDFAPSRIEIFETGVPRFHEAAVAEAKSKIDAEFSNPRNRKFKSAGFPNAQAAKAAVEKLAQQRRNGEGSKGFTEKQAELLHEVLEQRETHLYLRGDSPDKTVSNAVNLGKALSSHLSDRTLEAAHDYLKGDQWQKDLVKRRQNMANGYRADGKPFMRVDAGEANPTPVNPNFTPHKLADFKTQVLNLIEGGPSNTYFAESRANLPSVEIDAMSPRPKAADVPQQNVNPLEAKLQTLGKELKVKTKDGFSEGLNNIVTDATELIRLDRIKELRGSDVLEVPPSDYAQRAAGFMPETSMKTDMQSQRDWMSNEAKARGYSDWNALMAEKPESMTKMAAQWRVFHARDKAGTFLQDKAVSAINKTLYGNQKGEETNGKVKVSRGIAGESIALKSAISNLRGSNDPNRSSSEVQTGRGREEWDVLTKFASDNGLLLDSIPAEFNTRNATSGQEHDAWYLKDANRWIKSTRSGKAGLTSKPTASEPDYILDRDSGKWVEVPGKGDDYGMHDATPLEYLQRLRDQNELFGDDVRLHGIVKDAEGIRIITSQPHVAGATVQKSEVDGAMMDAGFVEAGPYAYYRARDNKLVSDLHGGNVVKRDGALIVFDGNVVSPDAKLLSIIRAKSNSPSFMPDNEAPTVSPRIIKAVEANGAKVRGSYPGMDELPGFVDVFDPTTKGNLAVPLNAGPNDVRKLIKAHREQFKK